MVTQRLLKIERLGGFAGGGLPGSGIRSQATVDEAGLSPEDQKTVDSLFTGSDKDDVKGADMFRYRLTRKTPTGDLSVEVPERLIPENLRSAVKDELI